MDYCLPRSYNTPYEKIGNETVELEVPFDIPTSWEWVRLREVCQLLDGEKRKDEFHTVMDAKFLRGKSSSISVDSGKFIQSGERMILVDGENSGEVFVAPIDGYMGSTFKNLWIAPGLCIDYVLLFIELYRLPLKNSKVGAAIPHLNKELFFGLLLPIPSYAEQERIVKQYTSLIPYIESYDASETKLNKLNTSFPEQLKKSILQWAVQGKLVPQDPSDEPAEALLERIRGEKERLVREGKIKKDKHESVIFRRDNSHYEKRGSETVCIDSELPFDIPNSWSWVRLGSLCKSITDGDHQPPPQVNEGIPFLVISDVSSGSINFSNTRYVPAQYYNELMESRKPQHGDLLFTVTGSYGIVIEVNVTRDFCFQRHIALIKPLGMSSNFLQIWLTTPLCFEQCKQAATGTAQKTVGLQSLRNLLIPIPPIAEQERILSKIDQITKLVKFSL